MSAMSAETRPSAMSFRVSMTFSRKDDEGTERRRFAVERVRSTNLNQFLTTCGTRRTARVRSAHSRMQKLRVQARGAYRWDRSHHRPKDARLRSKDGPDARTARGSVP